MALVNNFIMMQQNDQLNSMMPRDSSSRTSDCFESMLKLQINPVIHDRAPRFAQNPVLTFYMTLELFEQLEEICMLAHRFRPKICQSNSKATPPHHISW